jgi:hypothetical protein
MYWFVSRQGEEARLTARRVSPILPPDFKYVTGFIKLIVSQISSMWKKFDMWNSYWAVVKEEKSSPFKSVDTPVAKSPFEATASEPPRSTRHKNGEHIESADKTIRGKADPCWR